MRLSGLLCAASKLVTELHSSRASIFNRWN